MKSTYLYLFILFLGNFHNSSAQFIIIGRIVDEYGEQLAFANVLVCNDIFETTQWRWETNYNDAYSFYFQWKPDKRIFSISYSQPFGNKKAKGARKRSV